MLEFVMKQDEIQEFFWETAQSNYLKTTLRSESVNSMQGSVIVQYFHVSSITIIRKCYFLKMDEHLLSEAICEMRSQHDLLSQKYLPIYH